MQNPYQPVATVDAGSKRSIWSTLGMFLSSLTAAPCALLVGFATYMLIHDFYDKPLFRTQHTAVISVFSVAVVLFAGSAACFRAAKPRRGSAVFLFGFAYVVCVLIIYA